MADALKRMSEIDDLHDKIYEESGLAALDEERVKLEESVKKFVIAKGDYEDTQFKVTRVVAHRRWWDVDRLAKLMPKGMFLKVVDYVPNAQKIDELVKAGKVDMDAIKPAFIEQPNKPYAKITKRSEASDNGADEANSLAAKLQ